jgi:hypothetical protein
VKPEQPTEPETIRWPEMRFSVTFPVVSQKLPRVISFNPFDVLWV